MKRNVCATRAANVDCRLWHHYFIHIRHAKLVIGNVYPIILIGLLYKLPGIDDLVQTFIHNTYDCNLSNQ